MQFSQSLGLARGALVAFSLCFVARGAFAEAVAWDQKAVTQIAVELAKELRGREYPPRPHSAVPSTKRARTCDFS